MNVAAMIRDRSEVTPTGCWEWRRGRDWDGYGIVRVNGRSRRAHRVAYAEFIGQIPEGLVVRHSCDNPPCVNPAHLLVGTVRDNNRDREDRGRGADRRGENCPTAKLTWLAVEQIRAQLATGGTHSELARAYEVSRKAISKIANQQTWRSVTAKQYATTQRRA